MSEHTPGPWSVSAASDRYLGGEGSWAVIDSRGFEIDDSPMSILDNYAEVLGISHWAERPGESYIERPDEEREANAYLIAAAPDLLAACEDVLDLVVEYYRRATIKHPDGGFEDESGVLAQIRHAIAKAHGEQP